MKGQLRAAFLAMLLVAVPLWADDEPVRLTLKVADEGLSLPEKVTGQPAAFIKVTAQTKGENVVWVALDTGLNVFPAELLKDSRTTVVTAVNPGAYRLLAYTAIGGKPTEPAYTVVVIGTPPTPPDPPHPPTPDPLVKELQDLYAADMTTNKKEVAAAQAALYRLGAKLSIDPTVKTAGQLNDALKEAAKELPPGLTALHQRAGKELAKTLPSNPDSLLTDDQRKAASLLFVKLSLVLEGFRSKEE